MRRRIKNTVCIYVSEKFTILCLLLLILFAAVFQRAEGKKKRKVLRVIFVEFGRFDSNENFTFLPRTHHSFSLFGFSCDASEREEKISLATACVLALGRSAAVEGKLATLSVLVVCGAARVVRMIGTSARFVVVFIEI
jgi:hypothetical protein